MTERDLGDLLQRATDAIEPAGSAAEAWTVARRSRARGRSVVAVALVTAAVIVILLVGRLGGRATVSPPVSSDLPTSTSSTSTRGTLPVVQGPWDPADGDQLAPPPSRLAPDVPGLLDPPPVSADLAADPVGAAAVAVQVGRSVRLAGVGGEWRSVALTGEEDQFELSSAGTRLIVWSSSRLDHVRLIDLGSGEALALRYPRAFRASDYVSWQWLDEGRLLLSGGDYWVVPADGLAPQHVARAGGVASVDPDGHVVTTEDARSSSVIRDWADGHESKATELGRIGSLQPGRSLVAGVASSEGRPLAVFVAPRDTLEPTVVLPVRDPTTDYANGGLWVLALADDGTVLLRVARVDQPDGGFRVVAWSSRTGGLSLVASNPVTRQVSFASGLLRGS